VRSNCKFSSIWRILHVFNPFFWIIHRKLNLIKTLSDCNCTIIVTHSSW
jgi:hypothetical protein